MSSTSSSSISSYRPEIDALRGIQIIALLGYHAFPKYIPGGYVGVTIFFVISGYLITKILLKSFIAEKFSFKDFYSRRIKRIFPALILSLFTALFLGYWVLLIDDFESLGEYIQSGIFFVTNFHAVNEIGYFDNKAELKPLLHLWSLSIEEQFYLAYPILLFILFKYKKVFGLIIIFLISIGAQIYAYQYEADIAFYCTQYRVSEILIGGIIAYLEIYKPKLCINTERQKILFETIGYICVGVIIFSVFFYNKKTPYPSIYFLPPAVSTGVYIFLSNNNQCNEKINFRILVFFGLISYPLYLFHWILISFTRNYYGNLEIPFLATIFVLFIAIVISWLIYEFIEKKIRRSNSIYVIPVLLFFLILVLIISMKMTKNGGIYRFNQDQITNIKNFTNYPHKPFHDENCNFLYPQFKTFSACRLSKLKKPDVVIIGDSHANQYYNALASQFPNEAVMNISEFSCLPSSNKIYTSLDCSKKLNQTVDFLKSNGPFETVILSGYWGSLLNDGVTEYENFRTSSMDTKYKENFYIGIQYILNNLEASNIIIMGDNPELGFSPRICFNLLPINSMIKNKECIIDLSNVNKKNEVFKELIKKTRVNSGKFQYFDVKDIMCNENGCYFQINNISYYHDSDHLSDYGARKVIGLLRKKLFDGTKVKD